MKQKVKKTAKSTKTQEEILEILAKAEERQNESLFVDEEGDIQSEDEIKKLILEDTDDPELKHELYYKGIQKLLKSGLPKEKKYKEVREIVREEVNTFLAKGKRKKNGYRGADARMGFVGDMEMALDKIISWKANNGTATDLFIVFKELNDKMKI